MSEGAAVPVPEDLPPEEDAGDTVARARAKKSPNAFRTISEVADDLHIAQHVLRFWETKFGQVRPLKRGGGRRYYRPDDIALLKRIADLLYFQGYTIKGVQRLLREGGGRLSDDIGPPTPDDHEDLAELRDDGPRHERPPEPELPMPGLATDAVAARPRLVRQTPEPEVAADPGRVAQLEALLAEVLDELQALRALLP